MSSTGKKSNRTCALILTKKPQTLTSKADSNFPLFLKQPTKYKYKNKSKLP